VDWAVDRPHVQDKRLVAFATRDRNRLIYILDFRLSIWLGRSMMNEVLAQQLAEITACGRGLLEGGEIGMMSDFSAFPLGGEGELGGDGCTLRAPLNTHYWGESD
jgi:hypothetical protein